MRVWKALSARKMRKPLDFEALVTQSGIVSLKFQDHRNTKSTLKISNSYGDFHSESIMCSMLSRFWLLFFETRYLEQTDTGSVLTEVLRIERFPPRSNKESYKKMRNLTHFSLQVFADQSAYICAAGSSFARKPTSLGLISSFARSA